MLRGEVRRARGTARADLRWGVIGEARRRSRRPLSLAKASACPARWDQSPGDSDCRQSATWARDAHQLLAHGASRPQASFCGLLDN